MTVYFSNQADMTHCIKKLATAEAGIPLTEIKQSKDKGPIPKNSKNKNSKFIKPESPERGQKTVENFAGDSESGERIQVQIIDIPLDFTANRVKGALKHYGEIEDIKLSNNKTKGNKSALVYLRPNKCSKSLHNVWSIPMGRIMARIAINNNDPDIFAHRNKYTARLCGINGDVSPTRIMNLIRHTGAKSCHVPINSVTEKKRICYCWLSEQNRAQMCH